MLSAQQQTIQERILGACPALHESTPKELLLSLKKFLVVAYGDDLLRRAQDSINKWVLLDPKINRDDNDPPKGGLHIVIGGMKDFRRDPASAQLVRDDGAWIHFTITVRWDGRKGLELFAYDFEIVFPEGHTPPFLRIDLNEPGHANEAKELRSHIHAGNDDLQLPAPVMTPDEILHLFIHGLRPRAPDKPRA